MTLTPEARVLLTDALRPPAGYRVDAAVGTTYSLDLTALLLAPLSFAVFDQADTGDVGRVDPIRLLDAVRRHAEHTTIFCQAGGIHVPSNYRSILTFVEESVLEVMPIHEDTIFHPKIWALRFVDPDGGWLHRVVVLSRNMTLDRSWDTALVLDQTDDGVIDAAPAADFVRRLPGRAIRTVSSRRAREIEGVADSLGSVRLAAPSPFTEGHLLPIGLIDDPVWPFPQQARRLLAMSPFLTKPAVRALGSLTANRTLVSRAESLELIGSEMLDGWAINVLQRLAEVDSDEDITDTPSKAMNEFQGTNEGLHAKTFVVDLPRSQSMVVTGSANMTGQTWGRNVEFDAVLIGPTSACGVEAVLNGSPEAPGLSRILEEYTVTEKTGASDAAIETSCTIERFHQQLAVNNPDLHVSEAVDERVEVTLTMSIPAEAPGSTRVWLASLPGDVQGQWIAESLTWTVAPLNITPFIAVETTAGEGDAKVTRRCVLKASLSGAVDGRRSDAVFSILRNKQDVLRYLVFLLGDPSYDALFDQIAGVDSGGFFGSEQSNAGTVDVALFEPLVRATGRDADALARVAGLVAEIRQLPNGDELVPDGFDALWDIVWQAHLEHTA
ncbi:hypothetical protein HP550_14440 [Cellulomonas humilata]|uniref:PLD phosphodiesterase domain-containing protein n=1 Tax=Cellulomonas humilata TaxID=144055 RepID=A0A7Y6A4C6_9CELL|nr:phospholipase D family protein [Cellulomonas humilata]NUU18452.1 hypothetical protein [Cellulomonas humilata]